MSRVGPTPGRMPPPCFPERVGGQPGKHCHGQVGAQQVLRSLPGRGRRPEPGADTPLSQPEGRLEDGRARSEHQADDAGLGVVPGGQGADGLGGDVEATRKKLTATSCWARRSEVALVSRVLVNR